MIGQPLTSYLHLDLIIRVVGHSSISYHGISLLISRCCQERGTGEASKTALEAVRNEKGFFNMQESTDTDLAPVYWTVCAWNSQQSTRSMLIRYLQEV